MARVLIGWAGLQLEEGNAAVIVSWSALQLLSPDETVVREDSLPEITAFSDSSEAARVTSVIVPESAGTAVDHPGASMPDQVQTFEDGIAEYTGVAADNIDATTQFSGLGQFYPEFPQWEGTRLVPRSGIMERIATNGAVRLRALQSTTKYDPVVVHGFLTVTQRSQLLEFYTYHRTLSFTFTAQEDGVPRTCVFASNPFQIEPVAGMPNLYSATVYLREA